MGLKARLLLVTVCVMVSASVFAPAAGAQLPVRYSLLRAVADTFAQRNLTGSPAGSNDFTCKPSAAHPRPVVLVPGTFAYAALNWYALSPLLKNNGYCVFTLNYGIRLGLPATGPIADSARELATFVTKVLDATGASQVDLVGHSQGGMMPRYFLKYLGGAAVTHSLIGLAPTNLGGDPVRFGDLANRFPIFKRVFNVVCPACVDQFTNSDFLNDLNAGSLTQPGVSYTVIETRYDRVVLPYTNAFLPEGPQVKNLLLQDQCRLDFSEHVALAFDHIALQEVLNALDPANPKKARCTPVLPFIGG